MKCLADKRILVTGCCGTIGSQLIKILLDESGAEEIIGLDNNESLLFFQKQQYASSDKVNFWLADLRDCSRLKLLFKGVDYIFHSAAYKHVEMCELSPFEAVQTNIIGVQNVIQAALYNSAEKVMFTSSDKAVNPTNVMGTSKLMGERLMTAANNLQFAQKTIFSSTRFGNVLGSNGSVISIFKEQILQKKPVTLTSPDMTRFIMTAEQAARLVLDSACIAKGGEVFTIKMPAVKIRDLAEVMIEQLAPNDQIPINIIGVKPGEKYYEELMNEEEFDRTLENDKYFIILPAFKSLYHKISYNYQDTVKAHNKCFSSSERDFMSKEELTEFLQKNKILQA